MTQQGILLYSDPVLRLARGRLYSEMPEGEMLFDLELWVLIIFHIPNKSPACVEK